MTSSPPSNHDNILLARDLNQNGRGIKAHNGQNHKHKTRCQTTRTLKSHRRSTTVLTHLTVQNRHHHYSHHNNHPHHRLQPPSLLPPPTTLLLPPASQEITVIAAVRNPLHPTSQSLSSLPIHPLETLRPAHRQDRTERARRRSRCCAGARGEAWYRHH
ncbi:hypothetical protein GE21DRAFT_1291831 [Neurospora crassa]|nr:hypothetical protein GE21DRAFT_1291831 [Neurospora crassa]